MKEYTITIKSTTKAKTKKEAVQMAMKMVIESGIDNVSLTVC